MPPVLSSPAMVLVGLTGGVATGKSTVARMFKRCGAHVIDADRLAREVVAPGTSGWRAVVRAFGKTVLNPDRSLNRHALGAVVFRHPAKRRLLERIIHPRVVAEQRRRAEAIARKHPHAVVVYEVPLLFEAKVDKRVDRIVVVTTDRETQIARLKTRNGFSRAEALRRIRSQLPLKVKTARADHVLDGSTPRPQLLAQVRRLYRHLKHVA